EGGQGEVRQPRQAGRRAQPGGRQGQGRRLRQPPEEVLDRAPARHDARRREARAPRQGRLARAPPRSGAQGWSRRGQPRTIASMRLGLAICAAALVAAPRAAAAGEVSYLEPGAEVQWVALRAPLPTAQLGAIAATAPDRVRAAARGEAVAAAPALFGEAPGELDAGAGWAARPLAGAARGRAPLAAREPGRRCRCATEI